MTLLVLGTAVALAVGANLLGIVGLLALSVMALFYGAVITGDEMT